MTEIVDVIGIVADLGTIGILIFVGLVLRQDVRWIAAELLDILRDCLDIDEKTVQAFKVKLGQGDHGENE